MDSQKIRIAQDLQERIREVEKFLLVFNESYNVIRGHGTKYESKDINSFLKLETKKTIVISGRRSFGCGNHETVIDIPFDMIEGIEHQWRVKLNNLKKELDEL